jgi:phosphoglycolate phosphatase-like HAD superfamily hydrolase
MMTVRCVVFDFDGVLVHSNAIKREAYLHVLAERGASAELVAECLASHPEADRTEIITAVLQQLGSPGRTPAPPEVARYVAEYGKVCLAGAASCPEVTGASAALEQLSAEWPLYINSATPEEPLREIVDKRGWSRHFRGIMGRPHSKRDNLRRILDAEQLLPESVLFVGDRRPDMTAALDCGCAFVGLQSDESDFTEPNPLVLDTLEELPSLIRARRRK